MKSIEAFSDTSLTLSVLVIPRPSLCVTTLPLFLASSRLVLLLDETLRLSWRESNVGGRIRRHAWACGTAAGSLDDGLRGDHASRRARSAGIGHDLSWRGWATGIAGGFVSTLRGNCR